MSRIQKKYIIASFFFLILASILTFDFDLQLHNSYFILPVSYFFISSSIYLVICSLIIRWATQKSINQSLLNFHYFITIFGLVSLTLSLLITNFFPFPRRYYSYDNNSKPWTSSWIYWIEQNLSDFATISSVFIFASFIFLTFIAVLTLTKIKLK